MCGIAGILHYSPDRAVDRGLLKRMNSIQSHRGPDDEGYFIGRGVGLAHRRLSIIDISTGHQPIFNEDKSVCIVFNGEIYNYRELTKELTNRGHVFKTHSDTEAIVHAWEEWGIDCVKRLRGMFAFAIWDSNSRCLFIARDRLGIKPLYISETTCGSIVFGSELKVVAKHPDFVRKINVYAIEDYFSLGYIPEPRSIFAKTSKLKPGHYLLIKQHKQEKLIQKQYWDLPAPRFEESEHFTEYELRERFAEAVRLRLVSEVPIGAFLSGGVDSSAVVAMMAQLQPNPVNTCSIGFGPRRYDETKFAQLIADRYKTNHEVSKVQIDDFELLDTISHLYDEPYADSSALPTYRVCELAKKSVTVALSGDGGDELFGGYGRYIRYLKEEGYRDSLPSIFRRPLFSYLGRIYPKIDWAPRFVRGKSVLRSLGHDSVEGYHDVVSILRRYELELLYSPDLKRELGGYSSVEIFYDHANKFGTDDPLKLAQYIDFKTYLPGDILTKVDRASMAHSLEVRVPVIDHQFVEWAFQIPSDQNLQRNNSKAFFKRSLEPLLPNDVLNRKKMGFAVPLQSWFAGPLALLLQERLLSKSMDECGFFNMSYIEEMYKKHIRGIRDNSSSLWSLLMFEAFLSSQLNDLKHTK